MVPPKLPVQYKLPDPITRRTNISFIDSIITFKFSKPATITGIILEKIVSANALAVSFSDGEDHLSTESECFYIPYGPQDFAIFFEQKKVATFVKVFVVDRTNILPNSRIALF